MCCLKLICFYVCLLLRCDVLVCIEDSFKRVSLVVYHLCEFLPPSIFEASILYRLGCYTYPNGHSCHTGMLTSVCIFALLVLLHYFTYLIVGSQQIQFRPE